MSTHPASARTASARTAAPAGSAVPASAAPAGSGAPASARKIAPAAPAPAVAPARATAVIPVPAAPAFDVDAFRAKVLREGAAHERDLAWRHTRDPYQIWLSEVMLQQTQVARVEGRWQRWLMRFPTVQALAQASDAEVLDEWQGMGYNRRALALRRAACMVCDEMGGVFPRAYDELLKLPGVGPSTAAGIRAFAFDEAGVYLETNVRSVFIHELFPQEVQVSDATLRPLVAQACPERGVRAWYYALLDYGAWLKHTVPNPSRRAGAYTRQSRFEGSRRQKRAALLRLMLAAQQAGEGGLATGELASRLAAQERAAGREAPEAQLVADILADLAREGFCTRVQIATDPATECWCVGQ